MRKIFKNYLRNSLVFLILGGFVFIVFVSIFPPLLIHYVITLSVLSLSPIFVIKYLLGNEKKLIKTVIAITFLIISLLLIILSTLHFFENKDSFGINVSIAIKAGLSSMRAEAELWANANNESYSGFCQSAKIKELKNSIKDFSNNKYKFELYCNDSNKRWAACSNLLQENRYYCVDSNGTANENMGNCDENWNNLTCPE